MSDTECGLCRRYLDVVTVVLGKRKSARRTRNFLVEVHNNSSGISVVSM